jgi:hypothetical protein
MLDDFLQSGPVTRGRLGGAGGRGVAYELRLLSSARVEALAAERDAYLRERGIGERDATTDALFDDELGVRMCAACTRDPKTGAELLSLDVWRRVNRALIAQVIAHYAALQAEATPSADELGAILARVNTAVSARRSGAAREVEDYRVLFARPLFYFYGQGAARLSVAQVAYHALYAGELMPGDA